MRAVRRRTPSDGRCTYERVHDQVCARLEATPDELAQYLTALFRFDPEQGRDAYFALAQPFLNVAERAMLLIPATPLLFTSDRCGQCGEHAYWELDEARGERVCACGAVDVCGTVSAKYLPFDRNRPTHHAYRRCTHFTNVLDALTTKKPPAHVLARVEHEMRRQRVDPARLVHTRVRELMRCAGLEAHYVLAPTLLAHLRGETMPRLSCNEITSLHEMFVEVQAAFDVVISTVDRARRNFVSYPFLLRMCLLRIGRDDLANKLRPLKTPDKQRHQQTIWRAICKHAGWEYLV